MLRAALAYSRRGVPVFPCKPGGKEPLTKRGYLDATTDPSRITAWWNRWPSANIGVPTGERSGLLVLDVDPDKRGGKSLAALVREHGEMPPTTTVQTGGGGLHYYLAYPAEPGLEIRNSAGRLGPGLDVRGEGGYVVAPPSRTTQPYAVLDRRGRAAPPGWLLAGIREPHSPGPGGIERDSGDESEELSADPGGQAIPEGGRDATLTRIAGRLHDGRPLGELAGALMGINASRCKPPLPEPQVLKIARSIHARTPCKAANRVTQETLEALDRIEAELWRRDWRGMGGKSERDAYVALIIAARRHGERIPSGVRVVLDLRSWALAAAVSRRAMLDYRRGGERKPGIVSRLRARGLIRPDNADRSGAQAGAVVLLTPRAEFPHSSTQGFVEGTGRANGETLRAPRLRWSAPAFDRVGGEVIRSTVYRLGKGCGAAVDALERLGGSATFEEIAAALNVRRPRDLRRRAGIIPRLEAASVVECFGGTVSLTPDWLAVLNRERETTGEIAAYRRDMQRYEREREAYRTRRENGADVHPANAGADGWTGELEALPEPPAVEVLYGVMRRGEAVVTPDGPGRLWQVFSNRVGVLLDAVPGAVTFFEPGDLRLGGAA